jgi:hypothetical protein
MPPALEKRTAWDAKNAKVIAMWGIRIYPLRRQRREPPRAAQPLPAKTPPGLLKVDD